jgi:hypothetical protein
MGDVYAGALLALQGRDKAMKPKRQKKAKAAVVWVLQDNASKLYFQCSQGIGPRCSPMLALAARFPTRQAAMQSEAYAHPLMSFEPIEVAS